MRQERKAWAGSVQEQSESHGEAEELEGLAENIGGEFADADQRVVDIEQTLDAAVSHPDAEDSDRIESQELLEATQAAEAELATGLGTVLDHIRRNASKRVYKFLLSGLLLAARTGEAHASPRDPEHDDAKPAVEQQQPRRISGLREMLSKHGVVIEEKKSDDRGEQKPEKQKNAEEVVLHDLPELTEEHGPTKHREVVRVPDAQGKGWMVEIKRDGAGDSLSVSQVKVYESMPGGHRCYEYDASGNLQQVVDRGIVQKGEDRIMTETASPMKPIKNADGRVWLSDEEAGIQLSAWDQFEEAPVEHPVKTETHWDSGDRKTSERVFDAKTDELKVIKTYHYSDDRDQYPDRVVFQNPESGRVTRQEEYDVDVRRIVEDFSYDDRGRVAQEEKVIFFGPTPEVDGEEFQGKVVTTHAYDEDRPLDHRTATVFRSREGFSSETNVPEAMERMDKALERIKEETSLWVQEGKKLRCLNRQNVSYDPENVDKMLSVDDVKQNRAGQALLEMQQVVSPDDGKLHITNYERMVEIPQIPNRAEGKAQDLVSPAVQIERAEDGVYRGTYEGGEFSAGIEFEGDDPQDLRVKEIFEKGEHGRHWTVDGEGNIKTITLPDSTVLDHDDQVREVMDHEAAAGRMWPKIDDRGRVREIPHTDGGRQVYTVDDDGRVESMAVYGRGVDQASDRFEFAYDEGGHTQTRQLIYMKGGQMAVQVYDHEGKRVGSRTIEKQDHWFDKIQPRQR